MSWEEAVSGHVQQKITQVEWTYREFIDNLVIIESLVLRGGPKSFAEAMQWRSLRRMYPADFRCIEDELQQLKASDSEGYRQLLQERERKREAGRARRKAGADAIAALEEKQRNDEKRVWLSVGGRPGV